MADYLDHPFNEACEGAMRVTDQGGVVFQKFTCENCNSRQTIDVPNTFYTQGSCQECHHITDLQKRGCNYMVIFGPRMFHEETQKEAQARNKREVEERIEDDEEPIYKPGTGNI
jgi:hypothetical protein